MKNDIIYFFSQSWAVFFRHRNNLTLQHQIVGQVIEISVIWKLDNVPGKQPWTWFHGRDPSPHNIAKLQRDLHERNNFVKVVPELLPACWAGKKADFSFLLLKSHPTGRAFFNPTNTYWALTLAPACAKALGHTRAKAGTLPLTDSRSMGEGIKFSPYGSLCNAVCTWHSGLLPRRGSVWGETERWTGLSRAEKMEQMKQNVQNHRGLKLPGLSEIKRNNNIAENKVLG